MTNNQIPITKQEKQIVLDRFFKFGYWDLIIGIYLFVSCNLIIGYCLLYLV